MNLKELPRVVDSISYLYFEKCHIEQDDFAVKIVYDDKTVAVPCANLTVLFLGPGTTITHAAIVNLSKCGCLVAWCGENLRRFYAMAHADTRSSKNLLIQAKACMDDELHMQVVQKMYNLRFSNISITNNLSLQQLRGLEGVRMRTTYQTCAKHYGVKWNGKISGHGTSAPDDVNLCLNYINSLLYALCSAVINSLGFNCALGLIHVGHIESFVFDVADLYKAEIVIPNAFEVASKKQKGIIYDMYTDCRVLFRESLVKCDIVKRMIKDILYLFDGIDTVYGDNSEGNLWDVGKEVKGHKNYGSDDIGECL